MVGSHILQNITIVNETDTKICIEYDFVNGSQNINKTVQAIIKPEFKLESDARSNVRDFTYSDQGSDAHATSLKLIRCIEFHQNMSGNEYRLIAYDKLQHNLSDLCSCPAAEVSFSVPVAPSTVTTTYAITKSTSITVLSSHSSIEPNSTSTSGKTPTT